jgi:hypothetical protein
MFKHCVSFVSGSMSEFKLETDELFRSYQRWIQKDASFPAQGFTFKDQQGKEVVLNFSLVALMTLEPAPRLRQGAPGPAAKP